MDPENQNKVFHRTCGQTRQKMHCVLVRPEYGGNIGSTARALANMGILGSLRIVGDKQVIDASAWRMAKHAKSRLENALFFPTLKDAIPAGKPLLLASTARTGSAHRPHPINVDTAIERAIDKLHHEEASDLVFVFGPEADGLNNEEIDLCDWIVTIPSSEEYRSLNLAQAVLIFSYEVNRYFTAQTAETESPEIEKAGGRSQRGRLVGHFLELAEEVGFILPGDPYKMRPRLEEILSQLPPYMSDVKTLHGLLDQTIRSVKRGEPDMKGRYRHRLDEQLKEHAQ